MTNSNATIKSNTVAYAVSVATDTFQLETITVSADKGHTVALEHGKMYVQEYVGVRVTPEHAPHVAAYGRLSGIWPVGPGRQPAELVPSWVKNGCPQYGEDVLAELSGAKVAATVVGPVTTSTLTASQVKRHSAGERIARDHVAVAGALYELGRMHDGEHVITWPNGSVTEFVAAKGAIESWEYLTVSALKDRALEAKQKEADAKEAAMQARIDRLEAMLEAKGA